jgi:hypothetical protein
MIDIWLKERSMVYRYSYSHMLCYAMLCYAMLCCVYAYAVKKNDKDAGNITKGRKVEDKNIETDILCFVKRQKKCGYRPTCSYQDGDRVGSPCSCSAITSSSFYFDQCRTFADNLQARQRDHSTEHGSSRTTRSVDTASGSRTRGTSLPQPSCAKSMAVVTTSPDFSTGI